MVYLKKNQFSNKILSCLLSIIIFVNIFFSCKKEPLSKADKIVNDCIEAHGGAAYNNLNISFDFRDKNYKIKLNGDDFSYTRIAKDSNQITTKDIYTNNTFERYIADKQTVVSETIIEKYKNSINSVAYFTLLPKPLNDQAVNKTYIGESKIGGQSYHKIKVTFGKENGGKDHDDVYIYWINKNNNFIDYFAYSYKVDGGGIRFREKIKAETIGNIRFQDYINYAPIDSTYTLEDLDKAFTAGKLKEYSRIENKNYKIGNN
jgi:hypothetical protein